MPSLSLERSVPDCYAGSVGYGASNYEKQAARKWQRRGPDIC